MRTKANYSALDWTKPLATLAAETGVSVSQLCRQRVKNTDHQPLAMNSADDWRSLNWHRTNEEIAAEMGCAYTTVAINRGKYSGGVKAVRKLGKRQAVRQAEQMRSERWRHFAEGVAKLVQETGTPEQVASVVDLYKRHVR